MGYFRGNESRRRTRRRSVKRGSEDFGALAGLSAMVLLPFYWIIKYFCMIIWWMLKAAWKVLSAIFWFFFWPIKLFKKK